MGPFVKQLTVLLRHGFIVTTPRTSVRGFAVLMGRRGPPLSPQAPSEPKSIGFNRQASPALKLCRQMEYSTFEVRGSPCISRLKTGVLWLPHTPLTPDYGLVIPDWRLTWEDISEEAPPLVVTTLSSG